MDIYDKIDRLLEERSLSRRKLATMANIPPTSLQSAFSRKSTSLSVESIKSIAEVLGVPIDYLFGENELADEVQRFEAFLDYLKHLGYIAKISQESEVSYSITITKGKSITEFTKQEFEAFQTAIEKSVEFEVYKNAPKD